MVQSQEQQHQYFQQLEARTDPTSHKITAMVDTPVQL